MQPCLNKIYQAYLLELKVMAKVKKYMNTNCNFF